MNGTTINSDIQNMKNDIDILLKRTRNYQNVLERINVDLERNNNNISNLDKHFSEHVAVSNNNIKAFDVHLNKCKEFKEDVDKKLNQNVDVQKLQNMIEKLQIKHGELNWTVSYIRDILQYQTQQLKMIIPRTFDRFFHEVVESVIDNDDFKYKDYENIIRKLYISKTVITCSDYLDMCVLCDELGDLTKNKDEWSDALKLAFYDGLTEKEFFAKRWENKIKEIIAFLEQLPNKTDVCLKDEDTNNETTTLTSDNLLEKCVEYTKIYKPDIPCILQVIQHMLSSKQYVLSKDMFDKKLNLEQINKDFKLQAYQDLLTEDDLKNLLFV